MPLSRVALAKRSEEVEPGVLIELEAPPLAKQSDEEVRLHLQLHTSLDYERGPVALGEAGATWSPLSADESSSGFASPKLLRRPLTCRRKTRSCIADREKIRRVWLCPLVEPLPGNPPGPRAKIRRAQSLAP